MTKDELRTRVEAELLSGVQSRLLAEKYEIPYVTVMLWARQLNEETESTKVSDITQSTKASLEVIHAAAVATAPAAAKKIDQLMTGLVGLKELESEFHASMHKAIQIANNFLEQVDDEGNSTLTINEWKLITTTLSGAFTALFNKSGTTVNVAQTTVNADSENLKFFQASKKSI